MKKFFILFLGVLIISCGQDKSSSETIQIHADSTQIAGHIENYNEQGTIDKIGVYVRDLNEGFLDYNAQIDSLGKFEITIPIKRQQDIILAFKNYMPLIVQGGQRTELTLSAKDTTSQMLYSSVKIKGGNKKTNTLLCKYLAEKPLNPHEYFEFSQTASISEFISYKDSIEDKITKYISEFEKNNELTDDLKNWIEVDKNFSPLERVLAYPMNLRMFQKEDKLTEIPKSFFDALANIPKINEKHLINSSLYGSFGNYYTFHIDQEVRKANTELEPKSFDSLLIHSFINTHRNNPLVAQIAINEKLRSAFDNNNVALFEDHQNALIPLFKGSTFENIHSEKVAAIKKLLANPVLPQKAELLTFKTEDTAKYLAEIIDNAQGKVLYIDNWATWCAPCKVEFKNSTPELKKTFSDTVEFVYLCYQSKEELWKPTISQYKVEGKHYFVEKGKDKDLFEQIKLEGFPTYVIVNKKGEIVKTGFEYRPSLPETTEILTQLVAE